VDKNGGFFVIIPRAFHAWRTVSTDDAFVNSRLQLASGKVPADQLAGISVRCSYFSSEEFGKLFQRNQAKDNLSGRMIEVFMERRDSNLPACAVRVAPC
jgi:hypothetical protein